MKRGKLIVYLGAAPGVGKTYAMLGEGRRRCERGTDIVVAFADTRGRTKTAALLDGLPTVPRKAAPGHHPAGPAETDHADVDSAEMDLDAVLARRPAVALVDDLAHTNAPGSRNARRWQDVDELLDAGITVVSTVNIQNLESLNDVVHAITGVHHAETIPDAVVRGADQIELVDMSPEALRRRMAHGNVYPPEKVDAALAHYFRAGTLSALRELALLWLADRVDAHLEEYRQQHGIASTWPARERIVVALSGRAEGETLIRRGARLAAKGVGSELLVLYVARSDQVTGAEPKLLEEQRHLTESLGGTFHSVAAEEVPHAVLEFARGVNASQIVLGESTRTRLSRFLSRGVGATIVRGSGEIDVLVVTHDLAGGRGQRRARLAPARRWTGWALATGGALLLGWALTSTDRLHSLPTALMLLLALTTVVALTGGLWPAVAAVLVACLVVAYALTGPRYELAVSDPQTVSAVVVFAAVAVAVAAVVDRAARRASSAAAARREADTLFLLSGAVLRGADTLDAMLLRLRETFGMSSAALVERDDERSPWRTVAASGAEPCAHPEDADAAVAVTNRLAVTLRGRILPATEVRVVNAFAAQLAGLMERNRLREQAALATQRAEGGALRTTLLAGVSHDLRTPLATIKANVSSLRAGDVTFSAEDREVLLRTVADATDRLDRLVSNLLDLSRLRTDAVTPLMRDTPVAELFAAAAPAASPLLDLEVAADIPDVHTDPGLLERVLANVVENALRQTPDDVPVTVTASAHANRVEIRVVDRGPGVPEAERERMFEPFQRPGDAPAGKGVGLGLAVARGFADLVSAELTAEETPGGGLTLVLSVPVADGAGAVTEPHRDAPLPRRV